MKNLNDEKFLDTITYTMGGVQTVNRYYDDYPGQNIKWGVKMVLQGIEQNTLNGILTILLIKFL